MSVDAINTNAAQSAFGTAQAAHAAEAAKGLFMGHAVAASASPESILADAAEELGFAVDSTDDYEIDERKERDASDIAEKLRRMYEVLMHEAGKSEKMHQLVDSLKQAANRQAMRHALQQAFGDPTDAWCALSWALEALEEDASVDPARKSEVRALLADYQKENLQTIKLGLTGAVTAGDFPEVGGPDAGRDLYRQSVGEFSSVNEVFADIKAKYGDNFEKAMDFLFAAISSDIDSETPSMGRAHLESVHTKLGLVRLTQSAYRLCEDVMDRWDKVHGVHVCPMKSMDLLSEIVALRGNHYLGARQIQSICAKAAAPDIEHEVLFVQELMGAVRKFPVALFDDEKGRMTVMDAVQAAIDEAVEREDEYLASLE